MFYEPERILKQFLEWNGVTSRDPWNDLVSKENGSNFYSSTIALNSNLRIVAMLQSCLCLLVNISRSR